MCDMAGQQFLVSILATLFTISLVMATVFTSSPPINISEVSGLKRIFKGSGNTVEIDIYPLNKAVKPISKYIFGIFLEHHGEAPPGAGCIYHGIYAQILDNPSFEDDQYFNVFRSDSSIAYLWLAYGEGNVSYSRVEGYCTGKAQRITVNESPTTRLGIAQRVYCLLYTSPSPRDLSTPRMPSSA